MFPQIFPFPVLCARKVSRRANIFHFRTESRTSCLECAFLVRNPSYMAHCFPILPPFPPMPLFSHVLISGRKLCVWAPWQPPVTNSIPLPALRGIYWRKQTKSSQLAAAATQKISQSKQNN